MSTVRRVSLVPPTGTDGWSSLGVPHEAIDEARPRVQRMAVAIAVGAAANAAGWAVAALLGKVAWHSAWLVAGPTLVGLVASAALVVACRSARLADRTFVHLGLAYVVLLCFLGSYLHVVHEIDRYGTVTAFGPAVLVIAIFPLLLPVPPRLTFATALAGVAAVLGAALVVDRLGVAPLPRATYFDLASVPLASALLAYFVSRRVSRLHSDAARARRLGSYQLESRLGEGGMGEVWRARHHLLARSAAIKLIHAERLDPRPEARRIATERFHREARAIAALESAHTVRLFDFGATSGGTLYYAMELLDGIDLSVLVRKHGPMPPERVRSILLQMCDSLGEAHERGLVHRDVKPANVILCRLGRAYDFVKVLDFGIVALRAESPDPGELTDAGTVVGSPGFMAPEALAGEPCDARSDIYSIGCVAYWLLTGRKVFKVENRAMEVAAVMRDPVVRPSALGASVPRDLEEVVLACLAKLPEDRPASIDDLVERLSRCVDRAPWDGRRARDWWERHATSPEDRRVPDVDPTRPSPAGVVLPPPRGTPPVPPSLGRSTVTWLWKHESSAHEPVPTRKSRTKESAR